MARALTVSVEIGGWNGSWAYSEPDEVSAIYLKLVAVLGVPVVQSPVPDRLVLTVHLAGGQMFAPATWVFTDPSAVAEKAHKLQAALGDPHTFIELPGARSRLSMFLELAKTSFCDAWRQSRARW